MCSILYVWLNLEPNNCDIVNKKIEKYKSNGTPILLFTIKKNNIINYINNYDGILYEEN